MEERFSVSRKVDFSANNVFLQADNHDCGFLTIRLLSGPQIDSNKPLFSITGNAVTHVKGQRRRGISSFEVFEAFEEMIKSLVNIGCSIKDLNTLYGTLSASHQIDRDNSVVEVKTLHDANANITGANVLFKKQRSTTDVYQEFIISIEATDNSLIRESVLDLAKAIQQSLDGLRERPMMDSQKVKDKLSQMKSHIKEVEKPWYRRFIPF